MTPCTVLILVALAAIAAAPATPADPSKVAELNGRAPGKPQRCLGMPAGAMFATTDADPHLLIYDDGKTLWVNRVDASCGFEPGETIIPDQAAGYYCRGDFVREGRRIELSPFAHRCSLGDFTPYRGVRK